MNHLLTATGLTIGHRDTPVANGITFTLVAGEALAVLGPNGAGKSTLLRTLLGLIPPLAGEIKLHDQALTDLSAPQIAQALAYVPQVSAVPLDFSVQEVVLMARLHHHAWYAKPGENDHIIATAALTQMDIASLAARRYSTLSGGEQQLVLIARALASEAPILVLDEPVASLDFRHQYTLLDHLAELKRQGKAILFSTHHPEHAARLAEAIVAIPSNGEAFAGVSTEILTTKNLSALYGIALAVTRTESGALAVMPTR